MVSFLGELKFLGCVHTCSFGSVKTNSESFSFFSLYAESFKFEFSYNCILLVKICLQRSFTKYASDASSRSEQRGTFLFVDGWGAETSGTERIRHSTAMSTHEHLSARMALQFFPWTIRFNLHFLFPFSLSPPGTIILWVVIFILPINSALNPILYTITTSAFQQRLKQCLKYRCQQTNWHKHTLVCISTCSEINIPCGIKC